MSNDPRNTPTKPGQERPLNPERPGQTTPGQDKKGGMAGEKPLDDRKDKPAGF